MKAERVKMNSSIVHTKHGEVEYRAIGNGRPIVFIHGGHSNKLLKNSSLVELENEWGHLFWIGADSDESIAKVLEFINEKKPAHSEDYP